MKMRLLDAIKLASARYRKRDELDPRDVRLVARDLRKRDPDLPLDPSPEIHLREEDGSWTTYEQVKP